MNLYKGLFILFTVLSVIRGINFLFYMSFFNAISVAIAVVLAYVCRKKYLELKQKMENGDNK